MFTKTIYDIILYKTIKKGFQKNVNNFLKIPNKISKSQRKQINKAKQNLIISNISSKTAIIRSFNNSNKRTKLGLVSLKERLTSSTKNINIAIISKDTYCVACCLKKAQIFIVSLKNLQY